MKNRVDDKKIAAVVTVIILVIVYSCNKGFLDREPIGQISESTLATKTGVDGLLVGTYALLDGIGTNQGNAYDLGIWNAMVGNVAADEAHKGGSNGSQTERLELENHSINSNNPIMNDKWRAYYAGVQRANETLRVLAKTPESAYTEAERNQVIAEARFLRAVFHLEAAKMWRNVPYIDETMYYSAQNYKQPNNVAVWPKIEADLQYAIDNLIATKAQIGRANSWAAKAFLAKVYMFELKFTEAKTLLDDLIANGTNAGGIKYDLLPEYSQLYRSQYENGPESVFSVQMSVNDAGQGHNGNEGEAWNVPGFMGGWANQPSFSFVNSFKTENGLPMIYNYDDVDVKNDQSLDPSDVTTVFTPDTRPLDPRLDWSVGRRGLPYLDWGYFIPAWTGDRKQGGVYSPMKTAYWRADEAGSSQKIDGWLQATSQNYYMIRFADVLLWAAEAEVEIGSLSKAEEYVNRVRARAANPDGFPKKYVDDDFTKGFSDVPAANYQISLYSGQFTAQGKDYAREAVRFERKLELGLEGHRFFDLQRYDAMSPGYMATLLNKYIAHETATYKANLNGQSYAILEGARFTQGKNEIYPVPQSQIDLSKTGSEFMLKQNPGY